MAEPRARVCDACMTSRRPLIPAVLAATAALAPAAASAQQPTLQWDRPCYTEDQPMVFSGTGYTPAGEVNLLFARPGAVVGSYATSADAGGGIKGMVVAGEDDMLAKDRDRQSIFASANDRTRIEQGAQPPESQFAPSEFTFTRWMGFSPGRYVPGRNVEVEAYGWAFAAGKPLYFHFQRRRTTVKAVRAGVLSADCGDLVARVRVPKLEPGAYRLVLSTGRRTPSGLYTWRKGRVVKRAAASAAVAPAPMRRAG
jgi:hypothetical protein